MAGPRPALSTQKGAWRVATTSAFEVILYAGAHGFASRAEVPEGWEGPPFGPRADLLAQIEAALPGLTRSAWSDMPETGVWTVVLTGDEVILDFELPEVPSAKLLLRFRGEARRLLPVITGLYDVPDWGVVTQATAALNDRAGLAASLSTQGRRRAGFGAPSLSERLRALFTR